VEEAVSYVIVCTGEERQLLARLVEAEAQGEPFEGKLAVAAVVVNRVLAEGFPNSIREVIYQPGQFESVANGRLDLIASPEPEAVEAVETALRGEDPTGGAFFFYNPRKATSRWIRSRPVRCAIGKHLFLT
jgi:N-acetylmuramoyl-L-alanine amidase